MRKSVVSKVPAAGYLLLLPIIMETMEFVFAREFVSDLSGKVVSLFSFGGFLHASFKYTF